MIALMLFATLATSAPAQSAPASQATPKTDIVSVTGCLRESPPSTWTLVNATDPVTSNANAPAAKDVPTSPPPPGKNQFRLIGVSEFNLPSHKDHTVIIKGLYIKATPVSRLNITSVTPLAPSCAAAPGGPVVH